MDIHRLLDQLNHLAQVQVLDAGGARSAGRPAGVGEAARFAGPFGHRAQQVVDARLHVEPRTHVLVLFLHPLRARLREALQLVFEDIVREGRNLPRGSEGR